MGAAGGDRGVRDFIAGDRCQDRQAPMAAYVIPAPGEPGSETWKDKNNAWQTGGGAMWVTGTYDRGIEPGVLGHRQSGADVRPDLSSGRQSLHQQLALADPHRGTMNWYFQFTPGDHWDYDEAGTHILVDGRSTTRPASHHPLGA